MGISMKIFRLFRDINQEQYGKLWKNHDVFLLHSRVFSSWKKSLGALRLGPGQGHGDGHESYRFQPVQDFSSIHSSDSRVMLKEW